MTDRRREMVASHNGATREGGEEARSAQSDHLPPLVLKNTARDLIEKKVAVRTTHRNCDWHSPYNKKGQHAAEKNDEGEAAAARWGRA